MKLYRNTRNNLYWYAWSLDTGWVQFPAVADGWSKRQPARGLDPMYVREVPIEQALGTGVPVTPRSGAPGAAA